MRQCFFFEMGDNMTTIKKKKKKLQNTKYNQDINLYYYTHLIIIYLYLNRFQKKTKCSSREWHFDNSFLCLCICALTCIYNIYI